jgi:ribosome-associated protein
MGKPPEGVECAHPLPEKPVQFDDEYDYGPSRTERKGERKREAEALKKLGDALVALSDEWLREIPLSPKLDEAVRLAQRITAHGGRRRQLQLIGKLLRHEDPEPIREALGRLESSSAAAIAQHHAAERWRDRLLAEADAVTEFLNDYPGADAQRLRQLVRTAQTEQAAGKPPRAYRELFRFVRDASER